MGDLSNLLPLHDYHTSTGGPLAQAVLYPQINHQPKFDGIPIIYLESCYILNKKN